MKLIDKYILKKFLTSFIFVVLIIVMIIVVILLNKDKDVLLVGVIGEIIAISLGNFAAYVSMHRKIGEVLFINENFSIISVNDILYKNPKKPFPLRFANPVRVVPSP